MTPLATLLFDLDVMADHADKTGSYATAKALREAVKAIEASPDTFAALGAGRLRPAPGRRCSAKQMVLRRHPKARCLRQGGGPLYAVYLDLEASEPIARTNGAQECWALAAQQILAPAAGMAEARAKGLA
jgi:hypothetical protein